MRTFHIELVKGSCPAGDAEVVCREEAGRCRVELRMGQRVIVGEFQDFFEAFCIVRRELEKEGIVPLCYGASLNVYATGKSRGLGEGLCAYRLTPGIKPGQADLVGIFDSSEDIEPASVEPQKSFYFSWLESVGIHARR